MSESTVHGPSTTSRDRAEAVGLLERTGLFLFFLLLFVPTTYQPLKAGLIALILASIGIGALRSNRLAVHPSLGAWTLFSVTVSLFFMLRGLMHDAPGAVRVGTVYAMWPIVHMLFLHGLARRRMLWGATFIMLLASIFIGVYAVIYVLNVLGWVPPALYVPIDQGQAIGLHEGYVEINLYSLSSLLFLVPFALTCLVVWPRDVKLPVRRGWAWAALICGLVCILISGRRALLLIVGVAPVFILAFMPFMPAPARRASRGTMMQAMIVLTLCAAGFIAYLSVLGVTLGSLVDMFLEGFEFSRDHAAVLRRQQFWALLSGWSEQPVLGAGHGASAPGVIRSPAMPWAYELSYLALLFHVGIVGFVAYAAGVSWLLWKLVAIVRGGGELSLLALPMMVGMLCFLLGNATNPYLAKFDYMWVIFLPASIVNVWLLERACRPVQDGRS